jgi:predicted porin
MSKRILKALPAAVTLALLAGHVHADVSVSGVVKVALSKGNGGTTDLIDGPSQDTLAMHDQASAILISGKEDLGSGLHAGFALRAFLNVDRGTAWGDGTLPFWGSKSVVTLGGGFGEFYYGRALTPAAWMQLFADPWYWDDSAAQVGFGIQHAHYRSTAFVRTDNTIGYTSPSLGGLRLTLAYATEEDGNSKDVGGTLEFKQGPLWVGVGYDQSAGFGGSPTDPKDNMKTVVGAYDFGVIRPMFTVTQSKVDEVKYKSYSVALTAPVPGNGLIKAHYSHLNDAVTSTVEKEAMKKAALGYQYNISKRTNLFANISNAKTQTFTATRTTEIGVEHSF